MSMFEFRKPIAGQAHRDLLATLRETLEHLNAEPETPRIADLKRILAARIHELESKSA